MGTLSIPIGKHIRCKFCDERFRHDQKYVAHLRNHKYWVVSEQQREKIEEEIERHEDNFLSLISAISDLFKRGGVMGKNEGSIKINPGEVLIVIRCAECGSVTTIPYGMAAIFALLYGGLDRWLEDRGWFRARRSRWFCPECVSKGDDYE